MAASFGMCGKLQTITERAQAPPGSVSSPFITFQTKGNSMMKDDGTWDVENAGTPEEALARDAARKQMLAHDTCCLGQMANFAIPSCSAGECSLRNGKSVA